MKNHNRGFIAPFLIISIAILLVGGYLYTQNQKAAPYPSTNSSLLATSTTQTTNSQTPSQTPTSVQTNDSQTTGWKTYINTKYGFSFKYPSTWFSQESADGISFAKSPITTTNRFATFFVGPMYINKEGGVPQVGTPEVYHSMYYGVDSYNPGTQVTAQWITINGIPAFYHYVVGNDKRFPIDNRFVLYTRDLNFGFVLYAGTAQQPTTPTVYDPNDIQVMKEVIGTLKFTDSSVHFVDIGAEETAANYSVYKNQDFSYALYYPKNWIVIPQGNGLATTIKDTSANALPVRITAKAVSGARVDDGNGKTGPFTFYWDNITEQWKVDMMTNRGDAKTVVVKPIFVTAGGLQVFQGQTIFGVSDEIIVLSTDKFLLLSIDSSSSGLGGQKMLDTFARAFATANASLPVNIISSVVSAEAIYIGLPATGG